MGSPISLLTPPPPYTPVSIVNAESPRAGQCGTFQGADQASPGAVLVRFDADAKTLSVPVADVQSLT